MHKVGENRKWTEWPQTELDNLSVKSTLYICTKYLPLWSKFWSVSLYDQRFPRYRTFYHHIFPFTLMLNVHKNNNNKKKWQKSKIWKFTVLWTTVVETILEVCMIFWEWMWCVLSERMSFDFFPEWSYVNEKEKKMAIIQNLEFRQSLYNFGRDPP